MLSNLSRFLHTRHPSTHSHVVPFPRGRVSRHVRAPSSLTRPVPEHPVLGAPATLTIVTYPQLPTRRIKGSLLLAVRCTYTERRKAASYWLYDAHTLREETGSVDSFFDFSENACTVIRQIYLFQTF